MRTPKGRVVLPPVAALDANYGMYHFTGDDLIAVLNEALRQRRWWRVGHYLRLTLIASFLIWGLWILPAMALRYFPFD